MLIHLNDHRKPKDTTASIHEAQGLRVNWNPAFGMIALSWYQRPHELSPEMPEEAATLEPVFVNRVRALASQI